MPPAGRFTHAPCRLCLVQGLGRDGVVDSLQYALRKARAERDSEVREADGLFNQLQEARAAEQVRRAVVREAISNGTCFRKLWEPSVTG